MMPNVSVTLGLPAGPLALFSMAFLVCRGHVTVSGVPFHEWVCTIKPYVMLPASGSLAAVSTDVLPTEA